MNDYLYLLDEEQNPVGILSCQLPKGCPYWDDLKTEQLDHGLLTLDFTVPYNDPTAALIVNEGFIVRSNEENDGEFELFRIKIPAANRATNSLKVFAENAAVTDLLGQIVRPITLASNTIQQAMVTVLQNTGWQLGRVDYSGVQDFKFENYPTALAAVHQVMDQFGAEIKFRVEFNGSQVTGKYIDMLQRKGEDTGKIFSYGHDLTDQVERIADTTDLVTALIGIGPNDSNGNPMTFASYNPSVPAGYEKQSDWIGNTDARNQWGDGGKHIFGVYQENEAQNQVDLYNKTKSKLDELSKPRYTYNVGVLLLEKLTGYEAHRVRLGDGIQIQDMTFNPPLLLEARVIEKKTSIQDDTKNSVTLGDFVPVLSSVPDSIKQIQTAIKNQTVAGTGAHVVVNSPLQDDTKGDYELGVSASITIEVTNNCHLAYTSVFWDGGPATGVVELRDVDDNVIESRSFTGLTMGENVLKLNFLLSPTIGTYKLYSSFDGFVYRRKDEISFPYNSGEFKITATSDINGYFCHFFNMKVAGAGVTGGYGQSLQIGDLANSLGTLASLNTEGESTFVVNKDEVSIGVANIGQVNSESVVNYSDDDFTFYVNSLTGNDENDGQTSGTAFSSVARALQMIPRFNDGTININIGSDLDENITILGFTGLNDLNINTGTRTGASAPFTYTHITVTGKLTIDSCSKRVNFVYGKYFPSAETWGTGPSSSTVFIAKSDYVYFHELYISGKVPGTTNMNTNCVSCNDNSLGYFSSVHFQDWKSQAFRAANFGKIMSEFTTGSTSTAGALAATAVGGGAIVHAGLGTSVLLNASGSYPLSNNSNIITSVNGGTIQGVPTTVVSPNGQAGTSSSTPATTATTFITTANSSGRTYRYTKYIGWRSEVQVMEGDYGSGNHKGLWFFSGAGATPPWAGKTIKEIWIYAVRLSKGGGAGTVRFKTHNYLSQPAGNPTIGSAYVPAYFKYGDKKWVRLDGNATIKADFAANTAKGIAIDGGAYAIFSSQATLKVVYQ